jgi:hypothetical protein
MLVEENVSSLGDPEMVHLQQNVPPFSAAVVDALPLALGCSKGSKEPHRAPLRGIARLAVPLRKSLLGKSHVASS